jgi:hypothetical protein
MVSNPQIKSRQRVKDLAEVFTADSEINAMLDLIPVEQYRNPLSTWLEPACGNGNFLIAILHRKLTYRPEGMPADIHALQCLSSLYGIDIAPDNVQEAQDRLYELVDTHIHPEDKPAFLARVREILSANIIQGDSLKPDTVTIHQHMWTGTSYTSKSMKLSDCHG